MINFIMDYFCISAILVIVSACVYYYSRYNLKYWTRRGVLQLSNPHWCFGHFKDGILLRSAPGWYLQKLYRQAPEDSPYVGFYILQQPCLQLRDLDIIKQCFVKDFANFPDRYLSGHREKDSVGMRNLFGVRNPHWKILRSKITPTVTIEKLKRMLPLMLQSGKPMMDHIEELESDDHGSKHIDGQSLNFKYATDIIANVGLGISINSFENPHSTFAKRTEEFFHGTRRFIALMAVFFLPRLVDVLGPVIYFDMSYFKKLFWKTVEAREGSGIKRGDYIDSILKLKNGQQDPLYKIQGDYLFDVAGQLFSGFESGSAASTFTLMELAKNKEIQSRAREDIQKAIAEHGWTYDAFNEMKYLEQCILEGLRLYPSVPFLDRRARYDYTIPGTDIVIEQGTAVYVSVSALHRDPKHFPNPDEFDPGRFQNGRPEAYMSFGIGPKVCIASKLALLHVKAVLSLLLNEYEMTCLTDDDGLLDKRSSFTVASKGVQLELKKIKS